MNATGLNIIKTLGCMTAVTFLHHLQYRIIMIGDYHWILGFLTFISTIATPLFLWSRLSRWPVLARCPLAVRQD